MKKVSNLPVFGGLGPRLGMAVVSFAAEDSANPSAAPGKPNLPVVESNTRLRIATRLHFALLRHLGDTVEVSEILQRPAQTREVLWVCDASGDEELMSLSKQFREAQAAAAAPTPAAAPPQDAAWALDTSGFGVSRPPDIGPGGINPSGEQAASWRKKIHWLRGPRAPR